MRRGWAGSTGKVGDEGLELAVGLRAVRGAQSFVELVEVEATVTRGHA